MSIWVVYRTLNSLFCLMLSLPWLWPCDAPRSSMVYRIPDGLFCLMWSFLSLTSNHAIYLCQLLTLPYGVPLNLAWFFYRQLGLMIFKFANFAYYWITSLIPFPVSADVDFCLHFTSCSPYASCVCFLPEAFLLLVEISSIPKDRKSLLSSPKDAGTRVRNKLRPDQCALENASGKTRLTQATEQRWLMITGMLLRTERLPPPPLPHTDKRPKNLVTAVSCSPSWKNKMGSLDPKYEPVFFF